ncbi:hypothetical protein [Chitinophaga sancti]|uniref:Uncharacterized protein n=1 Tax=Chitinophaga sancti TaxID=1004 RepID=A0A1K1S686_9BACT|nr:hypothetical protein [Chitinophaga sancti]WQD62216.1 hypothetical protein U0033_30460 [Chitinophaga sancti]WQG92215.1 hypothetical protein SR876_11925 [Chitinophaga sancti]SFW79865.1 hypothetical protein SAMN05661012_04853 [Chitinophaga sancti]
MNKSFLITLFVMMQAVAAFAQLTTVAQSPLFKEPVAGYGRILHMKDGSTVFLQITSRDGLYVDIYDEDNKPKAQTHMKANFENLLGSCVNAVFESNNDITLFISEVESRQPVLYRIIIDGKTGYIKKDEKLMMTNRYAYFAQPFITQYEPVTSFFVRKDPNSENYALVILHNNDRSVSGNLEVIWYTGAHKEIARAYYANSDRRYKNINYLDMVVLGDEKVCLFAHIYNQTEVGDKKGQLIMATLSKTTDTLALSKVNIGVKKVIDSGLVKYDPVIKKIIFIGYAHPEAGDEETYAGICGLVDPGRAAPDQEIDIYPAKAVEKTKALANRAFTGMPQNVFVRSDGGFSIVYEELTRKQVKPLNAASYVYCIKDWLAVQSFNANGQAEYSCVIPRHAELRNWEISAFNNERVSSSAQPLIKGEQYRGYGCFQYKDRVYVTMNNTEDNMKKAVQGKGVAFSTVRDTDGYYYVCDASNELPAYAPLFGLNVNKDDDGHPLVMGVSDYDADKGRFITLKMDKNTEHRGVRVVWLQP